MRYNMRMDDEKINRARDYIKSKPYLMWSTSSYESLSPDIIVENILNYGDWDDFQFIKDLFGVKEVNDIFENIIKKKRINLRPRTINYFKMYFNKYA